MEISQVREKSYSVKCPDGSTKTVYKNVDDAFPLFINGWTSNIAARAKAETVIDGESNQNMRQKLMDCFMRWMNSLDLLHKSSASDCQLHVIDGCDQAEAETETLSPVSIPFAQNAEHFEFAEEIFNHDAFPR